jgi:hypothetical protein
MNKMCRQLEQKIREYAGGGKRCGGDKSMGLFSAASV